MPKPDLVPSMRFTTFAVSAVLMMTPAKLESAPLTDAPRPILLSNGMKQDDRHRDERELYACGPEETYLVASRHGRAHQDGRQIRFAMSDRKKSHQISERGQSEDQMELRLASKNSGGSHQSHRLRHTVGSSFDANRTVYVYGERQTDNLISRKWRANYPLGGFRDHAERTRTMVSLALTLGYDASIGALQANFGTPFENGIADLLDALARADRGAEIDSERSALIGAMEEQLETIVKNLPTACNGYHEWPLIDLDVNDDDTVNHADLLAVSKDRPMLGAAINMPRRDDF